MKHTEYEFPDGTIIYAFSALEAFCIYNAQQISIDLVYMKPHDLYYQIVGRLLIF